MTTKIQLDTKAMNALFPEGSEARVQLQNAVIANFVRSSAVKFAGAAFAERRAEIETIVSNEIARYEKSLKDYGQGIWVGNAGLTEKTKDQIKSQVLGALRNDFNTTVRDEIHEAKNKFIKEMDELANRCKQRINNHATGKQEMLSVEFEDAREKLSNLLDLMK